MNERPTDGVAGVPAATAAVLFRAIAVLGVVAGLVFGTTAWIFLGDLDENLDQSLALGESASGSVLETIDVAEQLIASLEAGLETVEATLLAVETTLGDTAGVAASTASVAASLPETFDDVDSALATVEQLSGAIDSALSGLSRVPFGPDYDPAEPLPDAIGNLRAAFEPIGADLTALSDDLGRFADGSDDVAVQLDLVRADLRTTRAALADSADLLDDYRATASDAGTLAVTSRDDMGRAFLLARIAVVLMAIFVIVAQFVPWWLAGHVADRRFRASPDRVLTDGPQNEPGREGSRSEHDT